MPGDCCSPHRPARRAWAAACRQCPPCRTLRVGVVSDALRWRVRPPRLWAARRLSTPSQPSRTRRGRRQGGRGRGRCPHSLRRRPARCRRCCRTPHGARGPSKRERRRGRRTQGRARPGKPRRRRRWQAPTPGRPRTAAAAGGGGREGSTTTSRHCGTAAGGPAPAVRAAAAAAAGARCTSPGGGPSWTGRGRPGRSGHSAAGSRLPAATFEVSPPAQWPTFGGGLGPAEAQPGHHTRSSAPLAGPRWMLLAAYESKGPPNGERLPLTGKRAPQCPHPAAN
jgi:hypothetical protein